MTAMTDLRHLANERLRDTNLTVGELVAGIEALLTERKATTRWPGQLEAPDVATLLEEMRRTLWTPTPETPSSLEMLREDRDR